MSYEKKVEKNLNKSLDKCMDGWMDMGGLYHGEVLVAKLQQSRRHPATVTGLRMKQTSLLCLVFWCCVREGCMQGKSWTGPAT